MVPPCNIARICTANSYKFAPRSGRGVEMGRGPGEGQKGPLPPLPPCSPVSKNKP